MVLSHETRVRIPVAVPMAFRRAGQSGNTGSNPVGATSFLMPDFAIIRAGGKQYKVTAGTKLQLDNLNTKEGSDVTFSEVLLLHQNKKTEVGTPLLPRASVGGRVLRHGRAKKIVVFHYRPKTRYRKKAGHRQPFTEVEITHIVS